MKILITILIYFFSFPVLSAVSASKEIYSQVEESRKNTKNWPALAYAVEMGWHDAAKFLIDMSEDVSAPTPSAVVWYEDIWSENSYPLTNQEPGYTPLELAILKQDPEMIDILTAYHPTNCAKVEFKRVAYSDLYTVNRLYSSNGCRKESTLLEEALNSNNDAVIDAVIMAHKDPFWLFNSYKKIAAMKNPITMRSFVEHNYFLWKEDRCYVAEEIVALFLEKNLIAAIESNDIDQVQQFLSHGWIISKEEFETAIEINDPDTMLLLVNHNRFQHDVDPFELLISKNKEVVSSIPFSPRFLKALAKCNRMDLFETLIDQADSTFLLQECFLLAVENGSLSIVETLIHNNIYVDGGLVAAVRQQQLKMVQYFLDQNLYTGEIEESLKLAYEQHDYEIIDALLTRLN